MDEISTNPITNISRPVLTKRSRPGGPVTCVSLRETSSGTCVIAARGPFLEKRIANEVIQCLLVFPNGGTIHGTRYSNVMETNKFDSVVFGGRILSLCSLLQRSDMNRLDLTQNSQRISHLTLMNWIWDVQFISRDNASNMTTLAIGMASHSIELWDIDSTGDSPSLMATRRHRIHGYPTCLVTSMDLRICANTNQLWVAAGTAFHEIRVWSCSIFMEDIKSPEASQESTTQLSCSLNGHAGIVHSVKFSSDGQSLASTSDDRSVRFWQYDPITEAWLLKWVGWGHSARVWSVVFAPSVGMVASVGEDGTMRLWSCATGELSGLVQHASSLWTVDTLDDFAVVGATDGTANLYDLSSRVAEGNRLVTYASVPVPDDRPQPNTATEDYMEASSANESEPPTKKKKKSKKASAQVIMGLKWEHILCGSPALLLATRAGSLMRLHIGGNEWKTIDPWWTPNLQYSYNILPTDGCCMVVREGFVAIGTTHGDIVLKSTLPEAVNRPQILCARDLKSVQGLKWVDSSTLVSFHVRTVAIWSFDSSKECKASTEPTWVCELEIRGKGVPLSCVYEKAEQKMIVGDSRGTLTLFILDGSSLDGESNRVQPSSVLAHVHQKEHVTDIAIRNGRVLSVGNDGCLHTCYISRNSLTRGWSIPASSMTGICEIWNHPGSAVCVTGYYGNTFRMIDIVTGHEFFHIDTGGRRRIFHCMVEFPSENSATELSKYAVAVCMNQKDGTNCLMIKYLTGRQKQMSSTNTLGLGVNMHSETIFSACYFTINKSNFLLTGSEDCTSKISLCRSDSIVDSMSLTPQESCVRAVCSSQFDESSALLVVGGGKLILQFFLVYSDQGNVKEDHSTVNDVGISLLGQLKNRDKASIDHRINAVKSLPMKGDGSRKHLIVAGDSDGCCHIVAVSEDSHATVAPAILVSTNSRPILCIDLLAVGSRVLVMIGNTGGEVLLFDLPGSDAELLAQWNDLRHNWHPLCIYKAHQMGTNTIHALLQESESSIDSTTVKICTGGDDQALCICDVSFSQGSDGRLALTFAPDPHVIKELSFSAIKGVFQLSHLGRAFVVSVGYSQQLAVWELSHERRPLLKARVSVDLGDINCLAVLDALNSSSDLMIAVGGLGIENLQLRKDSLIETTKTNTL
jgi:WD40 repeat protein